MKILNCICALLLLVASVNASATLVLTLDGDTLTGVTGLQVGSQTFDVAFEDGSCASLFSGCDEDSDFAFGETTAFLAAQALLNAVFLDQSLGDFDSQPELTKGCTDATLCRTIIPYGISLPFALAAVANNDATDSEDHTDPGSINRTVDFASFQSQSNFAVFTVSQAVPAHEPTTLALMGLALAGMGFSRRKAK